MIGGFVGALLCWISSKSYAVDLKKIDKKIMEEEVACREIVLK
jgi:hypothetical protein